MKKHLILTAALVVTVFSFAQKKEIKALEKAIKSTNFAEAKTLVSQLESMVGAMDGKMKDKYYLTAAKAFFANGSSNSKDILTAVESLSKISGNSVEASQLKKSIENTLLTQANNSYKAKKFDEAAISFENLYKVNPNNQKYIYYAASSAISSQDYDNALRYYLKLKDLGYSGVETQYFATNKASGFEEVLEKNTRDNYIKLGTHENGGKRTTESKLGEITKNIALIYVSLGDNDKALAAMKEARDSNPDDSNLIISEANLEYKLGNIANYESLIKLVLEKDPNNAEILFNLAVLASDSGDNNKAKDYYNKAILIKPNYKDALTNMAVVILAEEQGIVDQMNNLGTSSADDKKYDELKAKKISIYKEAVPYLEKVLQLGDDKEIGFTLANIYDVMGEDAKAKSLREKYI